MLCGGVMRIIEKLGYGIWYGAFVLLGVTLGLLLHTPLTAHGATIHDTLTVPHSGYWEGNTSITSDLDWPADWDTFGCIVFMSTSTTYTLDAISLLVAPNSASNQNNVVHMNIYDLGTATSGHISEVLDTPHSTSDSKTLSASDIIRFIIWVH